MLTKKNTSVTEGEKMVTRMLKSNGFYAVRNVGTIPDTNSFYLEAEGTLSKILMKAVVCSSDGKSKHIARGEIEEVRKRAFEKHMEPWIAIIFLSRTNEIETVSWKDLSRV